MKKLIVVLALTSCGQDQMAAEAAAAQQMNQPIKQSVTRICQDLQEADIRKGVPFKKCDGSLSVGTFEGALDTSAAATTANEQCGQYDLSDLVNLQPQYIKKDIRIAGVFGSYEGEPVELPDLTNLQPGNIRSGVVINGVTGSLVQNLAPENCTQNGQVGCVATAEFQAADLSELDPSHIHAGIVMLGVRGEAAVKPADCDRDGEISCVTTNTYVATRRDFSPTDLRAGITIAGVTGTSYFPDATSVRLGTKVATNTYGSLNPACSNGIRYAGYTYYQTVDDSLSADNAALANPVSFDISSIWYNTPQVCRSVSVSRTGADYTVLHDSQSDLEIAYSASFASGSMQVAIDRCTGFSASEPGVWRIPTQKEMLQLYINGIAHTAPILTWKPLLNRLFLSSTGTNNELTSRWLVNPVTGATAMSTNFGLPFLCVRKIPVVNP